MSIKLIHIATKTQTFKSLIGQLTYFKNRGFKFFAISSPEYELFDFGKKENIDVFPVEMYRRISPLKDLKSLYKLCLNMIKIKPHIVHSHTPKGGLLGMISAWLMRVPIRMYTIRGFRFMTTSGYRRFLLVFAERVSCLLAHRVLCVSHSLMKIAIEEKICNPKKIRVILSGSSNGIDSIDKFNPYKIMSRYKYLKDYYNIPDDAVIVGYIGRIAIDKGIFDLLESWKDVKKNACLFIIGEFELDHDNYKIVLDYISLYNNIRRINFKEDIESYYSIIDIVVLPTYREGFPNVLLEAAAMEIPVVATDVPGCIDAVEDGITGTLVPVKSPIMLANAINNYINDPDMRKSHGIAGRERVIRDFNQESIWYNINQEYNNFLEKKGIKTD